MRHQCGLTRSILTDETDTAFIERQRDAAKCLDATWIAVVNIVKNYIVVPLGQFI
jgi:hypothetical protein